MLIVKIPTKQISNIFVIFFLSILVLTLFVNSIDISFINFASAFTEGNINSGNNNSQQLTFNLKDWINIGNHDSDTISTLQMDNRNIDFPDTSIIIAIDGNNNILNNGDTTSSTLLKIDFVGQVDLTGSSLIVFECSLDSSFFELCTSPIIIDDLKPGEHTFEVRAIDESGNVDETPAQFRWIVIDLAEKLGDIKPIIDEGDIGKILKNNLNVILREIQTLVKDNNPNNDHEICNNLDEFILQITNNMDDITIGNANILVVKANAIFDKMQC
ncbi:MAG TPA: hypothetical protein VFM28_09560 [Nitrososphaeraceae archaeon]|nr:hypothetical protein [Nitrososphaeraceae archaeon]